jgi:hypothetical protein
MACYATDKALERHLGLLTDLRKHAIEKGLVLDRGIQDFGKIDSDLADSLMAARNTLVFPHSQKLFGFLRELGDRIETGSIQENAVANKWADLCNEVNAQVLALA